LRIDNNFCYFLKYLCSPEKGCFSCVALKRAVFCKCCYCCLMPVIFAWNSGCWSFSAKYLSDLCLDLSGKTCFNFGCWFPDLSVSQTSIFFRILYYFCHSRQLPWWSVFCCYLLLYRLGKSISFSRFKFKNCKPSHQTTLKFCIFKIKSAEI
jgi:hypothetical protein